MPTGILSALLKRFQLKLFVYRQFSFLTSKLIAKGCVAPEFCVCEREQEGLKIQLA